MCFWMRDPILLCAQGSFWINLREKGQPVKMSIATVNGIEVQAGRKVSLSAQGVGESTVTSLPNVISVSALPDFRSSIPTSGDCKAFDDELQGIPFRTGKKRSSY